MTLGQVQELHPGDEVYWNDPNEGERSRHITIQTIKFVTRDVVVITGNDGSHLECFIEELS